MASQPPSPELSSKIHTVPVDTDSLSDRLDALLESYLSILDTYTTLRAQFSKEFSSGFFALAQANRNANSTIGAGRRYGGEGFDERMKARRIVRIQEHGSQDVGESEKVAAEADTQEQQPRSHMKQTEQEQEQLAPESREATEPGQALNRPEQEPDNDTPRNAASATWPACHFSITPSKTSSKDPLKWYGILVPPALRTCQTHFTSAVSSTVPELLNTVLTMRQLEKEIWAVREELGGLDEYNISEEAENEGEDLVENGNTQPKASTRQVDTEPEISSSVSSLSPSRPKASPAKGSSTLLSNSPSSAGLPSEPRPMVLKIG